MTTTLLSALLPYIPPPLLRHVLAHPVAPSGPQAQRFAAAVLFADVSGFTPLTETLAQQGSAGAEEMSRLMNGYFERMIALLAAEGGAVVSFSGDGLTVVFPAGDEPLAHAVRRARQAAEAMQAAMVGFGTLATSAGPIPLGLKICIGAGEVVTLHVGGVFDRWEFVMTGDPLRQIAAAEQHATRGAIVLSPEAAAQLHPEALPPRALPPIAIPDPARIAAILRYYVPRAVDNAVRASNQAWLGELRPLSVLFIGAAGIGYTPAEGIDHLHTLVRAVQTAIYACEGSLTQVVVDDKGTVILAVFGAPPLAHEDDALRAVRCALDLQAHSRSGALRKLGITLRLGIASGRVFIGPVGGPTRRMYAAMGDTVNLAARLMGRAAAGEILCDFPTYRQARARMSFEPLPPVRLKGKASLVRIYRPRGEPDSHARSVQATGARETLPPLAGRQAEVARLEAALAGLASGRGRVLIIEGEAGIGKSRLVQELARLVRERGWSGLIGAGQSLEQQTPYRAWRDIFRSYFDLDTVAAPAERRAQVQRVVAEVAPDHHERLPLLNDVLNLDLPDTPLTVGLDPALRRQSLALLLIGLLQGWAREGPLVVVLEDAHWLDSLSWELAAQLARLLSVAAVPILLVLVARRLEAHTPASRHIATLRALPVTTVLELAELAPGEIVQFVAAQLQVQPDTLPESITKLVRQYAGGNPLIAQELILTLRDQGSLSIAPDPANPRATRCVVHGDITRITEHVPATVQGLILARLDRLPPDEQVTLKVAAVIGQIFGYVVLHAVLQAHTSISQADLDRHLHDLDARDITPLYTREPELAYMFRHSIIHEVTYQNLLYAQRRMLHRAVAEWYERTWGDAGTGGEDAASSVHPAGLSSYLPLLVHHYRYAGDREHERHYARRAGEWAAARYANAEAVAYFSRALDLTDARDQGECYALLLAREQVYDRQGSRAAQLADLDALEHLAGQAANPAWQAEAALRKANYHIVTSDYPAAIDAARRAADILRHAPDAQRLARAHLHWGRALRFQAEYAAAQQQLERALRLAQQHALAALEAEVLRQLGAVAFFQDDHATARECDERALHIFRALHNRQGEAYTLDVLGSDASEQGDYANATRYYEQALELLQLIGDQWHMCLTLGNLGQVCREQGDYTRAVSACRQGLALAQATGDTRTEGWLWGNLGWAYLDQGVYPEASAAFERGLALCRAVGHRRDEAWMLSGMGLLRHLQADHIAAYTYGRQALQLAEESGDRSIVGDAWHCLGHALVGQDQLDDAREAYRQSLAVWQEAGRSNRVVEAQAGLARVALARGDLAQALTQVEAILNYLEHQTLAGTDEPFRVYLTCVQVLQATHDARAGAVLRAARALLRERAATIADERLRRSYLENVAAHRALLAAEEY